VAYLALAAVDDQFAAGDHVVARSAAVTPHESLAARNQFARVERRLEMIVGTRVDRGDARVGGVGVGDDECRQAHAPLAQRAQPVEPGIGRAPQVEDDVVEMPAAQHRIGLVGPIDDVDRMASLAQRAEDAARSGWVIADDQDLHDGRSAVSGLHVDAAIGTF